MGVGRRRCELRGKLHRQCQGIRVGQGCMKVQLWMRLVCGMNRSNSEGVSE